MLHSDTLDYILSHSDSYKACVVAKTDMVGKTFHLHYHVLYDLSDFLNKPITYMEIGTYNGGSLSFMLKHKNTRVAIGVDPLMLPNQVAFAEANVAKFKKPDQTVHLLKEFSTKAGLPATIKGLVGQVDILFIDGAHDRASVIFDFEKYYALVAQNGFIVFDDYHDFKYSPEVHGAVNEIVERIKRGQYSDRQFNIIGAPTNFTAETIQVPYLNEFIIQLL